MGTRSRGHTETGCGAPAPRTIWPRVWLSPGHLSPVGHDCLRQKGREEDCLAGMHACDRRGSRPTFSAGHWNPLFSGPGPVLRRRGRVLPVHMGSCPAHVLPCPEDGTGPSPPHVTPDRSLGPAWWPCLPWAGVGAERGRGEARDGSASYRKVPLETWGGVTTHRLSPRAARSLARVQCGLLWPRRASLPGGWTEKDRPGRWTAWSLLSGHEGHQAGLRAARWQDMPSAPRPLLGVVLSPRHRMLGSGPG